MAAVDNDDRARHVRAGIGCEQQQRPVEILWRADPALRNPLDHRLAGFAREELAIDRGFDIAGCKRVDANAMPREFERHRRLPPRRGAGVEQGKARVPVEQAHHPVRDGILEGEFPVREGGGPKGRPGALRDAAGVVTLPPAFDEA